ncbi:hypothetical protein [Pistricoccus aurantiacus]|uniref:hypothetical protein n=1 Tax=Pistricoccus aurantiacus TaxID=1883414 RepID=UPI00362A3600
MNSQELSEETKQAYITASSHNKLAEELGISLMSLDRYARDNLWDLEHKLYWQDLALTKLKEGASKGNTTAIKELLKLMGIGRPVGRPPKAKVEEYLAVEANLEKGFKEDLDRLSKEDRL